MRLVINNIPHRLGFKFIQLEEPQPSMSGRHLVKAITTAFIRPVSDEAPPTGTVWEGEAFSYTSLEDRFEKKLGRQTALQRLVEDFPRAVRKQIWEQYWSTVKH